MTSDVRLRLLLTLFISIILALTVHITHREKINSTGETSISRSNSFVSGYLLPALIITVFIIQFAQYGFQTASREMLAMWFGDFIHLGIYYILLMVLLPHLRNFISARTCALLWIIPNYLYLAHRNLMELQMPLIVLHAPEKLIWFAFYIWMIGFITLLVWNILSHLIFRYQILRNSTPVSDPDILKVWDKEVEWSGMEKPKFRLVTSPQATTPVSIGLFRYTIRVILPERTYTQEELSLIFRHELVHIGREDAWSKFFLMFCSSMFWFNPVMWISKQKCSHDLELSCDEVVLLDCDDATRRKYATLILDTAGEERGFTTCLSASAEAMHYRLKNIVKPKKKFSGALTVGVIFFFLTATNGCISLAYSTNTGSELIYQSRDPELFTLNHITVADSPYQTIYKCADQDALHHYLSNLVMEEITGDYAFSGSDRELTIIYDGPDGILSMILYNQVIKVVPLYKQDSGTKYYYLPDGTDWEYLDSIIIAYPALNIQVQVSGNTYSRDIMASLWKLEQIENGETTILYETTHPEEQPSGIFGYNTSEAILDFSHTPSSEFTVKIETWDRQSSYTISETELEQPNVLPLENYMAHYMIYATFPGKNGIVYQAEFRFDFAKSV